MTAPEKQDELRSLQRFNDELVKTVEDQQKTIDGLREELDLFRRKLFGQSSERHVEDDSQLHLFEVGEQHEPHEDDEPDPPIPPKRRRRKKKPEKLPDHLRREVIEADVSDEERMCSCCGEEMPIIGTDITERLDLIPAELYVIEIRRHKRACGQRESVPIMDELHHWLLEQRSDLRVLPKSKLGKAVRYALNQWDELSVYLGDGAIPIDNNETESELRRLTIGRKNWLFVGSHRGGEVAAAMYSLVSSAARHHLDVWAYVDGCLRQLAGGSTDYDSLLPDVWRQSHPESIRAYRDAEKESRRLTTQQRRVRRREAKVA